MAAGHRAMARAVEAVAADWRPLNGTRKTEARFRSDKNSRGFSDPVAGGLRQAAGLSRQRRLRAEAQAVLNAMQRAYAEDYANVHRGLHFLANASTDHYEGARKTAARFLNAASEQEIIFTKNATEAINLVAQSFGGMRIGEGDEIALTIMEHHSNIVPWHFHRERRGAVHEMDPRDGRGELPDRGFRGGAVAAHENGRDHAHVQRARHGRSGEGGCPDCAQPRHSGADRRQPGRGTSSGRRAGHRLRLLCLYRPQGLRAVRHRRALRQARASQRHAALSGRRRDDRKRQRGPDHLRRPAASLRGGNAADRARRRASVPRSTI